MSRRLSRILVTGASLFLFVSCGEEPVEGQLYAPCENDEWCLSSDEDGIYLRCIVSPFGGSSEGFCSTPCSSSSDDSENDPILAGGCYPSDESECWLGCCYINNGWGGGGNGMCMPWAY